MEALGNKRLRFTKQSEGNTSDQTNKNRPELTANAQQKAVKNSNSNQTYKLWKKERVLTCLTQKSPLDRQIC